MTYLTLKKTTCPTCTNINASINDVAAMCIGIQNRRNQ